MKQKQVNIDWTSQESIRKAVWEKDQLEHNGWTLTQTLSGISSATLIYTK